MKLQIAIRLEWGRESGRRRNGYMFEGTKGNRKHLLEEPTYPNGKYAVAMRERERGRK